MKQTDRNAYGPTHAELEKDPDILTQKQLLRRLKISRQWFYQCQEKHGQCPSFRIGGRVYYPWQAAEMWWKGVKRRQRDPSFNRAAVKAGVAALAAEYGLLEPEE